MRHVEGIVARVATLVVVAGVVVGCGSSSEPDGDRDRHANDGRTAPDSVRVAIANLEEAAHEKDARGVCRLLFSTDFLPAAIRRQPELAHLELSFVEDAPLSQYDADQKRCFRQFGQLGEFDAFRDMPKVSSLHIRQLEPAQEITAVATATARA